MHTYACASSPHSCVHTFRLQSKETVAYPMFCSNHCNSKSDRKAWMDYRPVGSQGGSLETRYRFDWELQSHFHD